MKTALITGANKSIGFETARQLLQQGYYVYLGSRDIKKGEEAVSQLKLEGLNNVAPIEIDVDNIESIQAAGVLLTKKIKALDVLINNAGISGTMHPALETDINVFRQVFETNFFGVITVTQTFMDLLKQSAAPRIVNVTSGLGSLTLHNDPNWKYYGVKPASYVSSKAALNAYTILLANNLLNTPFKVNAVDPGYTATDFNHHSGPGTVPDAAARVVKAATLGPDGPTGQFFSDDNAPETGISPW
ncbi:SDR family oxidoreductase [Pedobacter alluvionis]|uniref:NAD(P)-dependent dehydrogenase (Short-subunit alcohol dehydrogenase family) n=1 Tax=Pedobacter alluvionis TaxID=475253 RepID=A0A497Y674_9SPHI|nr:SDR family oxidoreductase [Pedobacter alluvionis]RLJ77597.1 NAD(P)-dependent dehydrogenase (short-subunit alcohol dehydrogenase family) [Pedobacter alluvionis]TFB33194.1 SDR family oxidoreductase [Pedobacter alluvionis]